MAIRSRLATAVIVLVLSGILASPLFAAQREGPRREDPIVRVIKQLLRKIGIVPDDSVAIPKP